MKVKAVFMVALLLVLGACSEESRHQAEETMENVGQQSKELMEGAKQQAQEAGGAITDKSQQLYEEGKQKLGE